MLSKRIVLTFPRQLLGGLNKATFRVIFEVGFIWSLRVIKVG